MDVCMSSHLKEELGWVANEWLQVIGTFKKQIEVKGTKE